MRILLYSSHSHKVKMAVKLRTEYGSVLHMPTLKENLREKGGTNTGDPYGHKQYSGNQGQFALSGVFVLSFVTVSLM